ncbi:MAG: hypothetical protein ACKO04_08910 [Actinomycetes bacterium]
MGVALMDEDAPVPTAVPEGDADRTDRRTATWVLCVSLTTALLGGLWALTAATSLQVLPDEAGVWAVALFLSRGASRMVMAGSPTYSVAAGALLAPVARLVPAAARYPTGIVVMELVTLSAGWVMWRSGILGGASRTARALAAAVVVLLPASVFNASFTWVEALALCYFVVWCSASTWALRRPDLWPWCAVGVAAGLARLVHGRFVLLAVVWLVMAAVVERSSDRDRGARVRRLAAVTGSVALAAVAQVVVQRTVVRQVWLGDVFRLDSFNTGSAGPLEVVAAVARTLVGQAWYAGVSTAGLAWVGTVGLVMAVRREEPVTTASGRPLLPSGRGAVLLLASCASVWLVSALFMGATVARAEVPFTRYDHLVYGRYVAPCVAVLAAIGVATVLEGWSRARLRRVALSVGGILTVCGVLVWVAPAGLELSPVFPSVLPGLVVLPSLGLGVRGYAPLAWTLVALALGGLLCAARWWRRSAFVVAVVVLLVAGAGAAARLGAAQHRAYDYRVLYEPAGPAGPGRNRVVVASDVARSPSYRWALYGQQFELAGRGWEIDLRAERSTRVAASLPSDTGLAVLRWDVPLPGWERAGAFGDAVLWTPPRPR